jgi:uroporphyrinogen decarboxylase
MNSKQIMIDAIGLKLTPRTPVALLSGGVWTFNRMGFSLQDILGLPERAAEIILETNRQVHSDIVWPGSGFHNLAIRALGGAIKFRVKGAPDVQTPLLADVADLEGLDLNRLGEDQGIENLRETAKLVVAEIGEHTLVGSSQWGPFTLAGHIYGVERLMRSIYKDRAAVTAVLEFTTELCVRYLEPFIDAGVAIVSIADPSASGDLISRGQFQEYVLPYLKKAVVRLRRRGVPVSLHICGNITNRLDLIPESGAQVLSVDYKVDLGRVRELLGGRMAFAGNMNPVAVMQNASPEAVAKSCRECLAKIGDTPGYILMPGCDIPPGVPLPNLRAMVETASERR